MKKPAHATSGARARAVHLLDQVIGERRLISDLLSEGALDALDPADRARAHRLANDTLRGLERADRLLKRHLRKPPPLHAFNVLRLATVELCEGGDAHGVVNEAVAIIGAHPRYGNLKGLINAVLRKIADEGPKTWNDLRLPRLRKWLRDPLLEAYGGPVVQAIEAAHFNAAPLDLTARDDPSGVAAMTGGELLPTGSVRLNRNAQVSALPGYDNGSWWVQDAAAAIAVRLLAPQPGETVLDLCAAPGGKTMQLAAAGAVVTAVDISEKRLRRVRENLDRAGLKADCMVQDVLAHHGGPYDAILLDAPCSATGTIRRHPDLPHARDGAGIEGLITLQAGMLDHAIGLLRPGGKLVFCTCSLLPDEGECQIEDVLDRHEGLEVVPVPADRLGVDPGWITAEGGLRLRPDYWPERGGMDGFFMACLRRRR